MSKYDEENIPDAYMKWMQNLTTDLWLDLMEKYASSEAVRITKGFKPSPAEDWMLEYFTNKLWPTYYEPNPDAGYELERESK